MKSGITDFYIVIGYNGDKIKKRLTEFSLMHSVRIDYINNENWNKPNGISVLAAKEKLKEPFILLMSDHLFDYSIIKELKAEGIEPGEIKLAVDKRIENNPLVDIDDVTKVLEVDNIIQNIGKNTSNYNAFDTGIFLCDPVIFIALEQSIKKGNSSLSGGILELANSQKAKTFDIGNHNWIDVDDEKAYKKAERIFTKGSRKYNGGNNK